MIVDRVHRFKQRIHKTSKWKIEENDDHPICDHLLYIRKSLGSWPANMADASKVENLCVVRKQNQILMDPAQFCRMLRGEKLNENSTLSAYINKYRMNYKYCNAT
ncbi:unnamed protein product [Orchesella dallaii]|uniref:Uncharacterized protein n=1 Tax=Orchesella dallaii TaxID=48710 RepID=A0ABP1S807_9HEXA